MWSTQFGIPIDLESSCNPIPIFLYSCYQLEIQTCVLSWKAWYSREKNICLKGRQAVGSEILMVCSNNTAETSATTLSITATQRHPSLPPSMDNVNMMGHHKWRSYSWICTTGSMRSIMHNIIFILHHPSSLTFITLLTFTVDTVSPGERWSLSRVVVASSLGTGHVFLCPHHLDCRGFTASFQHKS